MKRRNLVVLLCWYVPAFAAAADKVYYFVDEQGVPHFSNVPADRRYKLWDQASVISQPAPASSIVSVPIVQDALQGAPLPPEEGEDANDR